jgi:hypothetical protein
MMEEKRLTGSPIFIEDLCAVFHSDRVHALPFVLFSIFRLPLLAEEIERESGKVMKHALNRRSCRDENGEEPRACGECDHADKLERKLAGEGQAFFDARRGV